MTIVGNPEAVIGGGFGDLWVDAVPWPTWDTSSRERGALRGQTTVLSYAHEDVVPGFPYATGIANHRLKRRSDPAAS